MTSKSSRLRDDFHHKITEPERRILRKGLEDALIILLETERPVALEPFGILAPLTKKSQKTTIEGDTQIIRNVVTRTFEFHKTGEITRFHHDEFKNLVEEKELVQRVATRLPLDFLTRYEFRTVRLLIRGLIEHLKHECISLGLSQCLKRIGTFVAIHNRQGDSFPDWFAGADVSLVSPLERTVLCEDCKRISRPVLNDAWEFLGAALGKPVSVFKIRMKDELQKLGIEDDSSSRLSVALFEYRSGNSRHLIYCTDGLRQLGISAQSKVSREAFGNEIVFQVDYDTDLRESARLDSNLQDDLRLPNWPKLVLALGAMLLQSNSDKVIRIGEGLSAGRLLCGNPQLSKLSTVLATPFARSSKELLSKEGPFYYINLVGITDDEAKVAERTSPDFLLALLNGRRCDQVTRVGRPCLTNKSSLMGISFVGPAPQKSQIQSSEGIIAPAATF